MGAICVQTHLGLFAYNCSQIRELWFIDFIDIHVETTGCSKQTKNKKEDTKTHYNIYIVHVYVYSTLHVCMYVCMNRWCLPHPTISVHAGYLCGVR